MSARTDTTTLAAPSELARALSDGRRQRIHQQAIIVDLTYWNSLLDQFGLHGGPIEALHDGVSTSNGTCGIAREDIFQLGPIKDADSALRVLWFALAWGSGKKVRLSHKRLSSIHDNPQCVDQLVAAASYATSSPQAAYEVLHRNGKSLIKYLGPAFFTKYLYFAGRGAASHPSLILDSRVASALRHRHGWKTLGTRGNWPSDTYARYCDLLQRWAAEESERIGREIAADEIERFLFDESGET